MIFEAISVSSHKIQLYSKGPLEAILILLRSTQIKRFGRLVLFHNSMLLLYSLYYLFRKLLMKFTCIQFWMSMYSNSQIIIREMEILLIRQD